MRAGAGVSCKGGCRKVWATSGFATAAHALGGRDRQRCILFGLVPTHSKARSGLCMHARCSLACISSMQEGSCNSVSCISMPTRLARGKQLGNLRCICTQRAGVQTMLAGVWYSAAPPAWCLVVAQQAALWGGRPLGSCAHAGLWSARVRRGRRRRWWRGGSAR